MPTDFLAAHRPVLQQTLHDLESQRDVMTQELDQKIAALKQLLGDSVAPSKTTNSEVIALPSPPAPDPLPDSKPKVESVQPKSSKLVMKSASRSKTKQQKRMFDVQQLTPEFKGLDVLNAVQQVLEQSPDQVFDTPSLIKIVYGEFEDDQAEAALRSLRLRFSAAAKKGHWVQVSKDPTRFQALRKDQSAVA